MPGPIATLYFEELKATMRGRFAWLGAAAILLAVGGLATVGTQDTWLDGYGIIAYGCVPLVFIPLAAGMIASPRANRFVESVFTSPVDRRDWLVAKILVLLTLAAAYNLALVPMMLVYVHHVGLPFLLQKFLIWTPGILVVSLAIGTLVGVLFIGRSIAAPAATGMGVLLVYATLVPLQELLIGQGNGATRTGHLVLISPVVLLKNALGFTIVAASLPETTTLTWIALGIEVVAASALALWVFLRVQGVETWEATRGQRWTIAAAIAGIVLAPVALADTNYDRPAPPTSNAPAIRGIFARASSNLVLVPLGGQPPGRCCATILNRESWPLGTDERTRQDLLILLPVDPAERITDLRVQVSGENGLEAAVDPGSLDSIVGHLETRLYVNDSGPAAADGRHVAAGWVARVPVTLTPTHPWDLGGDRYPMNVTATYRVGDESQPRTLTARGAVDAQVAPAIYEMGVASSLLPLFCIGAAFTRWRRTR